MGYYRIRCSKCKHYVARAGFHDVDPSIGHALRLARRRKGWTLTQLALESGYSENSISRWERGKVPLRDEVLTDLYESLDGQGSLEGA